MAEEAQIIGLFLHWNVVGRTFIAVHEMLDPQVDLVRDYADVVAERIATMGGSPRGLPGDILSLRTWDDYSLGRDTVSAHLAALDKVYEGIIVENRAVIDELDKLDMVTQDLIISQTGELEKFQWFIRAHLEDAEGRLADAGADTESGAAQEARERG